MGWTCFVRGPYDTRGRTAKQGPKRLALPRGNATGAVPPHKTGPPHRAVGTSDSDCPGAEQVGWGGPDGVRVGTGGSECPGAELVGRGGPGGGWVGTAGFEWPVVGRVGWADLTEAESWRLGFRVSGAGYAVGVEGGSSAAGARANWLGNGGAG
ncbi:hypothetical protein GCM10010483_42500 [Actinokineospora diospyrosa]